MDNVTHSRIIRLSDLDSELHALGLVCFGKSAVLAGELEDVGAGHVVLIGHVGGENRLMWDVFVEFCSEVGEENLGKDPLDSWTYSVLSPLGKKFGGRMYYPFSTPPLPFIGWALRSGVFFRSPIGVVIHPFYGVWTAFRGALFFSEDVFLEEDTQQELTRHSPCLSCLEKPCLGGCPVGAFNGEGNYDVDSCVGHISATRNDISHGCYHCGCFARLSCPVGSAYSPSQRQFHMRAFLSSRIS